MEHIVKTRNLLFRNHPYSPSSQPIFSLSFPPQFTKTFSLFHFLPLKSLHDLRYPSLPPSLISSSCSSSELTTHIWIHLEYGWSSKCNYLDPCPTYETGVRVCFGCRLRILEIKSDSDQHWT